MTQIKSALTGIYPTKITESGEDSSLEDLNQDLSRMSNLIHTHAQTNWNNHSTLITTEISKLGTKNIPYKRDFLRKTCGINNSLPRQKDCLIGLMKEIADHKTISEAESYIRNPNPYKQIFKYNKNIDLSIANNNLAKLDYTKDSRELTLTIRVMEKTYKLLFTLPKYLLKRNIAKVSKPRIRLTRRGDYTFDFTIFETVNRRKGSMKVGVDLGKIEPYYAVIATSNNKPIASYTPSKHTRSVWRRYENLHENIKGIRKKIEAYKNLGLDSKSLESELESCVSKRSRLHLEASKQGSAELVKNLGKHSVSVVHVEDLRWTKKQQKGVKQKAGSWSFSRQQSDLEHSLSRIGVKVKKVRAAYSSQCCSGCGAGLKKRSNRSVWCEFCKKSLDRDFNAALNLASLKHLNYKKLDSEKEFGVVEGVCSEASQGIADLDQSLLLKVRNIYSIE